MHYELVTIVSPQLSETEVAKVQETLRSLATAAGATITKEDPIEKRKLAYPVKHEQFAYIIRVELDTEPSAAPTIHNRASMAEHVLRSELFTKRVKTAEELAHEAKIRERMARERAEQGTQEVRRAYTPAPAPASAAATASAPLSAPTPAQPIDIAELDKKLDELLDISVEKL